MGTTYTRQSSFSDGDTITAALFNNEYDQLLNAFAYASSGTTGHQHDGTAAEGGNIHTIGDQDFLNKIVADSTNNRWGVFVEVSSSAVEQIRIQDGAIVPVTDNDIDLGTSSLEFKDAYFDGTVTTDALTVSSTTNLDGAIQLDNTLTAGVDDTGHDIKFFGATSGSYLLWDESADSLLLTDSTPLKIGDSQDLTLYHDGSNSYVTNAVGALKLATETSGIAITIGHTTSETTIADNLTVTGNASIGGNFDVTGTIDFSDSAITNAGDMQLDSITGDGDTDTAITFSGSNVITVKAANADQVTFTDGAIVPSTDNDIDLGTSSTEFKDAYFDGTVTSDAFAGPLTGDVTGNVSGTAATVTTAAQTNITSLGTLTALTVDDVAINGKVITMTGSSSDTAVFTAGTNGTLSIVTTDDAAAAANIQITADGTVDIDSAGVLTLDSGAAINLEPASGSAILLDGTISVDGSSVYATDLILGEDSQTAIDFGTANEIDFKADNAARLTLTSSALYPVTDNEIDLGTSSLEFKDAFFDGTVTADAFAGPLTGNVTGNASGTAATVTTAAQSNITSLGTLTTLTVDNIIINGTNIGHTSDTDSMAIASDGVVTFSQIPVLPANTIDSDHYVDGSIDTAHLADNQVTLAKMAGLARGKIIYGDSSGDPAALAVGSANYVLTSDGTDVSWAAAATGTTFQLEDDDGTEVTIADSKEVKFIGSGITTNWTDTDNGTDGDPYDLTFTVDAAQTGITSIYATDLIMGEDSQTAIDFGTANEIDFKVDNAARLTLTTGALYPVTDNQIDLGTSSLEFKDAFFDGTVTADAFAGPLTGNVTGNASGTAATVTTAAQSNITSLGTLTTLTVDNVIINGTTIGHTSDTDLMTVADGVLTVAGELDAATLDISGNADIDGTTNLDAVDIDGNVQIDGTVTVGVDDTGKDVKFFGATSGKYLLWDESDDSLNVPDNTKIKIGTGSDMALYHDGTDNYMDLTNDLRIRGGGADMMYFQSTGNIYMGGLTSEPANGFLCVKSHAGKYSIVVGGGGTDSFTAMAFAEDGDAIVGTIAISSSSTAYNTSSDYRLKENVVDLENATDRLKLLKPYRFNFIDTARTIDGFYAHEVSSIVPEAITGAKDAVDENDNIVPQGIDQAKLVPLLIATVQELEARIAVLEGE